MPAVVVVPAAALHDRPFRLRVIGARPGAEVAVNLTATDANGTAWRSRAVFVASDVGEVDTLSMAPVAGDYTSVDEYGLLWSASTSNADANVDAARLLINLDVTVDGERLEAKATERSTRYGGVAHDQIEIGGMRADFYRPDGATGLPAVLVLGGTEAGDASWARAALLGARGFAALALHYRDVGAEQKRVPIDFVATGVEWLLAQPSTSGRAAGVVGVSAGGIAALLACGRVAHIAGVVALSAPLIALPHAITDSTPPWTFRGEELPFAKGGVRASFRAVRGAVRGEGTPAAAIESLLAQQDDLASLLAPAPSDVPILAMAGDSDPLIPLFAVEALGEMLRAQRTVPTDVVVFRDAGHLVTLPGLPAREAVLDSRRRTRRTQGGTTTANARSARDAWERAIAFLTEHIGAPQPVGTAQLWFDADSSDPDAAEVVCEVDSAVSGAQFRAGLAIDVIDGNGAQTGVAMVGVATGPSGLEPFMTATSPVGGVTLTPLGAMPSVADEVRVGIRRTPSGCVLTLDGVDVGAVDCVGTGGFRAGVTASGVFAAGFTARLRGVRFTARAEPSPIGLYGDVGADLVIRSGARR